MRNRPAPSDADGAAWRRRLIGHTVGKFRVVAELGSGATACVFLARRARARRDGANSQVALKVLHPHLASDPRARARFMEEGELGRRLDHPALAALLETIEIPTADGLSSPVHVFEHAQGVTLRTLMDRVAPMPEPLVRKIGAEIARALAALHATGILHGDVKPSNVVVTRDHVVKLLDLGVARPFDTAPAGFAGSIPYAAPEQLRGEPLGPAADLHALGVVLHEAATGLHPFAAPTLEEVRQNVLALDPTPPSASAAVSHFLDELVGQLLSKVPGERFTSVAALADALDRGERSPWWLGAERTGHPARNTARSDRPLLPFVGRELEIDRLMKGHDRLWQGLGEAILIEGEAGIGKTRLVLEMLARVHARPTRPRILHGEPAPDDEGTGPGGVRSALVAHWSGDALDAARERHLASLGEAGLAFVRWARGLGLPSGLSSATVRVAASRLAQAIASEGPVLWIVEDAHRLSLLEREALVAVAEATASHPIQLVITARTWPEGVANAGPAPAMDRLRPPRLTTADSTRLIDRLELPSVLSDQLRRPLAETAAGHPLLLSEMIRMLLGRGVLRRDDGGALVAGDVLPDPSDFDVTTTVESLFQDRIAHLTPREAEVLEAAAVQGAAFSADLIARVLRLSPIAVLEKLVAMERATGAIHWRGDHFEFDHQLLRDVVWDRIADARRARLHGRYAEALLDAGGMAQESPDDRSGADAVVLAHHFLRSDQPDRGVPWIRKASEELAHRLDQKALGSLADLVASVTDQPALLAEVLGAQARACYATGTSRAHPDVLDRLEVASRACGDRHLVRMADVERGKWLFDKGDFASSRDILQAVLEAARSAGDEEAEERACVPLAHGCRQSGRWPEAIELATRALALADARGDLRSRVIALGALGGALMAAGAHQRSLEVHEEQLELARQLGDPRLLAGPRSDIGLLRIYLGQHSEAERVLRQEVASAEEFGLETVAETARLNLGIALTHGGRNDEARQVLGTVIARAARAGRLDIETSASFSLGRLELIDWRVGPARDRLLRALELASMTGSVERQVSAHVQLGHLERLRGRLDDAMAHAREALALAERHRVDGRRNAAAGLWAIVAADAGHPDAATRLQEATSHLTEGETLLGGAEAALRLSWEAIDAGDAGLARSTLTSLLARSPTASVLSPLDVVNAYMALLGDVPAHTVRIPREANGWVKLEMQLLLNRCDPARGLLAEARRELQRVARQLPVGERETFSACHPWARRFPETAGAALEP